MSCVKSSIRTFLAPQAVGPTCAVLARRAEARAQRSEAR